MRSDPRGGIAPALEEPLRGDAAILSTARRIPTRTSVRIPVDPECDDEGLRMELIR